MTKPLIGVAFGKNPAIQQRRTRMARGGMFGENPTSIFSLENLLEGLEDGNLKSEDFVKGLEKLYDEKIGNIARPFVKAAPRLAVKAAKDLAPLLQAILKLVNVLLQDAKLNQVVTEFRKHQVSERVQYIKDYQEAGFSREEAMALLLTDIARTAQIVERISSSVKTTKEK